MRRQRWCRLTEPSLRAAEGGDEALADADADVILAVALALWGFFVEEFQYLSRGRNLILFI
jgi:hypothetical protein